MHRHPNVPEVGPDPLSGTPYRVVSELASGGMAEVYLAEHTGLGRRVVVKLLREFFAADNRLVDRCRVEAEALGRLEHPNIIGVTDCGWTRSGRPYLVTERLIGTTLAEELRLRGHVEVAVAVGYVQQVLHALEAAHGAGMVHRDIKPENVFIAQVASGAPVVKVLDFGLAKIIAESPAARRPLQFPTEEGLCVGTPRHISPEQARGDPIDHRSDIYSTAVLLYKLIAGRGPWDYLPDASAIVRAQVEERPPRPSALAKVPVPRQLEDVIMRGLNKDPAERFQSASGFAVALEDALYGQLPDDTQPPPSDVTVPDQREPSPRPPAESRGASILLTVVIGLAAAVVAYFALELVLH